MRKDFLLNNKTQLTMKRFITLLLSVICLLTAKAQSVDERVGAMMTSSDWFELERELPALKDSIQWPSIRLMAEALVASNFNRDDEAVSLIDTLVAKHQAEIGFENTMNLVVLQSMIESRRGNYAKADDILNNFISQVKAQSPQTDISTAENSYKLIKAKRDFKPLSLTRPAGDVTINAAIRQYGIDLIKRFYPSAKDDTTRRAYSLCLPVEINGKHYEALLDTGSPTTYCSMNFAREIGARISPDTTRVLGARMVNAFIGSIDSINIGPMTMHNAETIIVEGDFVTDSLFMGDFVIGLDFLMQCGEAQFYPKEGKIVFPERLTPLPPTGHNIYRNESNAIFLEAYVDGERCKFIFDTGHASNLNFSKSYYDRHKLKLDKTGKKTEGFHGGVGYTGKYTYLMIPDVTVNVGGTDITFNKAAADYESVSSATPFDGNVGVGLIQNCRKATLNLRDLFLKIEN